MEIFQSHIKTEKRKRKKIAIDWYNWDFILDQNGGSNTLFFFSHRFQLFSCHCVGYRIRLGSSTDKKDTGRLHVDFAQARDDLYEWECRQRMLAREERHRRKMEEDRLRPPSPPPIVHYSEHECSQLGEKIKGWGDFSFICHVIHRQL